MGREDSGHADVVIRYRAQRSNTLDHHAAMICLDPEMGCTSRGNVSVDQCDECQKFLRTRCFTHGCMMTSALLCSCGLSCCCLYPYMWGPACSFRFVTESAANAALSVTAGMTSAGRLRPGAVCFVFGTQAVVVEDRLGGTYAGIQMTPIPPSQNVIVV